MTRNTIRALHKPPLHNPKEEAPMNTAIATTSPVNPSTPNLKQPQQITDRPKGLKEAIAAKVKQEFAAKEKTQTAKKTVAKSQPRGVKKAKAV
jgi:hypothetical protein